MAPFATNPTTIIRWLIANPRAPQSSLFSTRGSIAAPFSAEAADSSARRVIRLAVQERSEVTRLLLVDAKHRHQGALLQGRRIHDPTYHVVRRVGDPTRVTGDRRAKGEVGEVRAYRPGHPGDR